LMSPFFNPGRLPLTSSPSPQGRGESFIPIYIAGVNTGLARLAGEVCGGFHVHPFHSPRFLQEIILPAIEQGAQKAGRTRKDVTISVTAFVASSPEEREFARAQIAFYASTPSYRPVFALHGWKDVAEQLSTHAARGDWAEMPSLVSDEMLGEFCLIAEPGDLPAALKARYAGLADRLTLYSPFVPGERDEFWQKLSAAFNI
jgi:probable F420-dependent oxidoreductase